jgi:hypothetical protein
MKTKPLAILVAAVFFGLLGCSRQASESEPGRFERRHYEKLDSSHILVFRDRKTGHQYIFVKNGYGAGMSLMPEETTP